MKGGTASAAKATDTPPAESGGAARRRAREESGRPATSRPLRRGQLCPLETRNEKSASTRDRVRCPARRRGIRSWPRLCFSGTQQFSTEALIPSRRGPSLLVAKGVAGKGPVLCSPHDRQQIKCHEPQEVSVSPLCHPRSKPLPSGAARCGVRSRHTRAGGAPVRGSPGRGGGPRPGRCRGREAASVL